VPVFVISSCSRLSPSHVCLLCAQRHLRPDVLAVPLCFPHMDFVANRSSHLILVVLCFAVDESLQGEVGIAPESLD
jgi:hypothetical protein